jgi:endonuclease-8
MAEGDTIHRLARRLTDGMAGTEVAARAPNPRGAATGVARLDGMRLGKAEARGKHLLLWFEPKDDGQPLVLHSHLAMSGSWHLYRPGERWSRPERAAWAVLSNARCEAVEWGGPTLRVMSPAELRRDAHLRRLGPDILAPDFEAATGVESMRRAEPARSLGDALLDQRLIAGIGNIYKSEACFEARVSPWRAIGEVTDAELTDVLAAARELMSAGVTSRRVPKRVYRRAGRPCPRCGAPIRSRGQGDSARTTYWCSTCQPR